MIMARMAATDLRQLLEPGGERSGRKRVECDPRGLAHSERGHVGLVDARAHLHGRRVDDVHDAKAGAYLLALLHLAHRAVLPRRLQHDHAVDRRHDAHLLGVALRVLPRVHRAVALNLECADLGGVHLSPQGECLTELARLRPRLVERQRVLLGGDRRHNLVLEDFELRAPEGILRLLDLGRFVRAGGELIAALLVNLLDEIAILGLTIVSRLDLRLTIELDEQVAALDSCAWLDEVHNDQRAGTRPAHTRNDHGMASDRLDRALQT